MLKINSALPPDTSWYWEHHSDFLTAVRCQLCTVRTVVYRTAGPLFLWWYMWYWNLRMNLCAQRHYRHWYLCWNKSNFGDGTIVLLAILKFDWSQVGLTCCPIVYRVLLSHHRHWQTVHESQSIQIIGFDWTDSKGDPQKCGLETVEWSLALAAYTRLPESYFFKKTKSEAPECP